MAPTEPQSAPQLDRETLRHCQLDARLVAAVGSIRLLPAVAWPASLRDTFLADWQAGRARLPRYDYPRPDLGPARIALAEIAGEVDRQHPVGRYLLRRIESWSLAAELIEHAGHAEAGARSIALFGRPGDPLPGGAVGNLDAARHFLGIADELDRDLLPADADYCIPPELLRADLQAELERFFVRHPVTVVIDPDLTAKAAAGAARIRLRGGTCFSAYDRNQLLQHEAYVHTLTALNGREQPYLKSLGRTAPHTLATQEGLAVFAELISGVMDIERMKRISLRTLAIDMALSGADFIEVFRWFLDAGQTAHDSFASSQRVFRGVPLDGGSAFTKDGVYLHGLIEMHTFFRHSLAQRRLDRARTLFVGKLGLDEVDILTTLISEGVVAPPEYLPPWMQRVNGLAGTLAFSLFANRIRIDRL
ncbi:MAG TPA: flavohemoglobin expression-modulating QEGLA motif protein [Xanthomonadales bacterium]|nr:flavohemoglobin expression-modulating QEGLA motif protein [Xanthomonadales bacterium]